jgi:hypothetical protein
MEELKPKNERGRPIVYKEAFNEQVFEMALLGLTDVQMCNILGVSEPTFNAWKKDYPDFFKSLTQGKTEADGKVAKAMYNRALGVTVVEQALTRDGEVVDLKKELPSDTAAAKHWLANRQRALWANLGDTNITTTEPLIIIRTEGDKE